VPTRPGVSILEPGGAAGVFRWHAIAGQFASKVGGQVPREASPCGTVLDRNASLLFTFPERHFNYCMAIDPPIVEALLVPFYAVGQLVGAVWVMAHTPSRKFDMEDQRVLTDLSRFAATAYQMKTAALAAIRTQEEVRQILDTAATGITRCSRDLRYISANPAYAKLAGLPVEQIVGRPIIDVMGLNAVEVIRPYIERVLRGERVEYEDEVPFAVGGTRFLRGVYTPWVDSEGHIAGWVASLSDITDLKHTSIALLNREQELQQALRQLSTILQAAPIGIVTTDQEGKIATWNDAAERIFGYRADEVLGRINPSIPHDALAGFHESLSSALTGKTIQTKGQRIRKDRSIIEASLVHAPHHDEQGNLMGVITLVQDITEKTNTEKALARVRTALAEVQVEEARRIAGELHDDIGQRLALLSFEIGRMVSGPPRSHEELVASLHPFKQKILDVCDGLREISHRMHPSLLEHLGLPNALRHLCNDFSEREGIPVNFLSDDLTNDIPKSIGYCFYRVAQEALHNISKHAKANHVTVELAMVSQATQLCIIDTGAGFDISAVKSGLGLHSMRERVELVNGALSVTSEPGIGTRIVVNVPLNELLSGPSLANRDEARGPYEHARQIKKCRLLIGDDHPLFVAGIGRLLEDTCDVVGTAGDGLALVHAAERLKPELILIDISMPTINGFEAARRIHRSVPDAKLLFLTTHSDAAYADEAFKSGATGYLVKQAALAELPKAIEAVLAGHTYRSGAIANRFRGTA
jgi:PAS domain S-box-containing protein